MKESSSILITGGSGSFGQALVRALIGHYDRICIYSRGEHTQAAMRESLEDHPSLRWFIGDVRDRDRLRLLPDTEFRVMFRAQRAERYTCSIRKRKHK